MRKLKYLLFILLLSFILPAQASNEIDSMMMIDIIINGNYIKSDARPFIVSGTTYVPVRFISEALCVDEVIWDSKSNSAIIKDNKTEIVLPTGKNYGYINGKYVTINKGIKLVNNRTFVPIRFISESLGATVGWDGTYFTVRVDKQGIEVHASLKYDRGYTNEDLLWLARIVEAEASGEPIEGKIAVGNVILNRVKSPDYPNTIYDVIFDRKFGVQFQPVANGTIYNNPSFASMVAAKCAIEGINYAGSSLYFLNPAIATSSWIINNRPYYTTIDNHSFYL